MKYVKLKDCIIDMHQGINTVADKVEYYSTGFPIIQSKNITSGYLDLDDVRYVDQKDYDYYKEYYNPQINDILFTNIGTVGKSILIEENYEFLIAWNLFLIRLKSNYNNKYFLHFFEYLRRQNYYDSLMTGGTVKFINKKKMGEINVPLYDTNKQQEIVFVLDKINSIIDADKKQLELLDEAVKSRFIEMFGDPILNDKDWQIKDLNEITDVRDGTHDSPKYYDNGYPFVTSKNLVNGKIDFSSCQLICEEDYLHFNDRSCVDDGDILMPMIGTIGGAIIVKKDRDFAIKNVALIKFNKDNSIINRTFILNILNSDSMNEYFNNVKKGGTQNFISLGLIRKIPTVVPPIELQNEFDSFVEQIDQTKSSIQQHLTLMQELLDKKMEEFFGGK